MSNSFSASSQAAKAIQQTQCSTGVEEKCGIRQNSHTFSPARGPIEAASHSGQDMIVPGSVHVWLVCGACWSTLRVFATEPSASNYARV
ncbi:hypothetical protein BaRGS_00026018 [Batillaria attramentaria]|uniref:Uncharacterized protein n=1 Tax=Batillaria attramentaria TaxID=370345 RepID=A0ABD0K5Q3_9CAEN